MEKEIAEIKRMKPACIVQQNTMRLPEITMIKTKQTNK